MDSRQFDALTKALTEAGTRRGLLGVLATLPVLGGLFALLGADEADAKKNRRKRRKKPHKRAGRRRKKQKQRKSRQQRRCKAESRAKTCANRCGTVRNTCKKKVNCGSCICDPLCPDCQVCDAATGQCVPDPSQQGDDCGEPGQVCQADGTCACDASSCAPCEDCQANGVCSLPCDGEGCCDAGTCASGFDTDACGRNGEACVACSGPGVTCGGGGTPNVCGCTPISSCPGELNCGEIDDGCGSTISCGGPCANPTPVCVTNVCTICSATNPCPTGQCCAADGTCGACLVFVTSTVYDGNIGGLEGAHLRCQTLAGAASLPGTYKAWLSDEGVAAPINFFTKATAPYTLTNGETIANNWDDLTDGTLAFPIDRDENGNAVATSFVWTNTNANGTVFGVDDCQNWTGTINDSMIGATNRTSNWSQITQVRCTSWNRLFCFQQS